MNKNEVIDFFKDLIFIFIVVFIIRYFFAMPFQINGQSMYSSYFDKGFIIVDRLSSHIGKAERGDVIVFQPHVSENKKYFLKRIIGIPGDKIRIEEGKVYVKKAGFDEFEELDEKYLNDENKGYTFVGGTKSQKNYNLGEDQYFVLGDNRNHSTDSRECFSSCAIEGKTNFISKSDITGYVFLDLGYFNFKSFKFIQPQLGINTTPKWFSSASTFDY